MSNGESLFLIYFEAIVCKHLLTLFFYQNLYFMSDHFDVVDRVLVLIVGTELELNFKTSPRVPCLVLGPPLVAAVCRAGVVSSEANCVNLP